MTYDMKQKRDRTRFVSNNWAVIAPWGYGAYLQLGRGAVVIGDDFDGPAMPRLFKLADIEAAVAAGKAPPDLLDHVKRYDPDREVVVAFDLTGFAFAYGRYQVGDLSPKDLWLDQTKGDKPL